MANLSIRPVKKIRVSLHAEKCCFCLKSFHPEEMPISLDLKKVDSLISVFKELSNEVKIRNGDLLLRYRKSCRSKYMHPFYRDSNTETKPEETEFDGDSFQFTRSKASQNFNWKENCFICGEKCNPKNRSTWSMVQTAINRKLQLYLQVLEAAQIRDDKNVISRLLSANGDLVAVEARYHRTKGCLAKYISERNIKSVMEKRMRKTEITFS